MNITFKGQDGSVAFMTVVDEKHKDKAIADFLECHAGFYQLHSEGPIKTPTDRKYRDAWVLSSKGTVIVDKNKIKPESVSSDIEARLQALEQCLIKPEK